MEVSGSGGILPGGLEWNTHIACLARVCDYAGLPFDTVDVAGMTGLAFRTIAVRGLPPGGMYHTWSFPYYFQQWFDALGIVAIVGEHDTSESTYVGWLGFWQEITSQSIASGYPVVFWDNVCFNLLTAVDDGCYSTAVIPASIVPPGLESMGFSPRVSSTQPGESIVAKLPESQITPEVGSRAFLACPILHSETDPELAALRSLNFVCSEMKGQLPYTRAFDDAGDFMPMFGNRAVSMIGQEVGSSCFNAFGAQLAVYTVAEARQLGCRYLKRIRDRLGDKAKPRLELTAEFLDRTAAMWAKVCLAWDEPAEKRKQAAPDFAKIKDVLFEIQRTEDTAHKVVAGLVADLGI